MRVGGVVGARRSGQGASRIGYVAHHRHGNGRAPDERLRDASEHRTRDRPAPARADDEELGTEAAGGLHDARNRLALEQMGLRRHSLGARPRGGPLRDGLGRVVAVELERRRDSLGIAPPRAHTDHLERRPRLTGELDREGERLRARLAPVRRNQHGLHHTLPRVGVLAVDPEVQPDHRGAGSPRHRCRTWSRVRTHRSHTSAKGRDRRPSVAARSDAPAPGSEMPARRPLPCVPFTGVPAPRATRPCSRPARSRPPAARRGPGDGRGGRLRARQTRG